LFFLTSLYRNSISVRTCRKQETAGEENQNLGQGEGIRFCQEFLKTVSTTKKGNS